MITGATNYIWAAYGLTYGTLFLYGVSLAWRIARAKREGPHG